MDIDEKITLTEYDVNWEAQYNFEKSLLQAEFPDVYIEHIGSTAVKGMISKPIIDIMIGVVVYPPSEDIITGLEKLGYYHFGEHNTKHAHLYFVKRGDINFNIHIDKYNSERWNYLINFKNYLIENPDIALEYSKIKRSIIEKGKDTMISYSNEKMEFIKNIIDKINN